MALMAPPGSHETQGVLLRLCKHFDDHTTSLLVRGIGASWLCLQHSTCIDLNVRATVEKEAWATAKKRHLKRQRTRQGAYQVTHVDDPK